MRRMNQNFLSLLEESTTLNGSIITLTRLQLLISLAIIEQESITYREFKSALQPITDGALYANLNALIEMRYIKKEPIKLEEKELDSYHITPEGKAELERVKSWLKKIIENGGSKNETR